MLLSDSTHNVLTWARLKRWGRAPYTKQEGCESLSEFKCILTMRILKRKFSAAQRESRELAGNWATINNTGGVIEVSLSAPQHEQHPSDDCRSGGKEEGERESERSKNIIKLLVLLLRLVIDFWSLYFVISVVLSKLDFFPLGIILTRMMLVCNIIYGLLRRKKSNISLSVVFFIDRKWRYILCRVSPYVTQMAAR